MNPSPSTIASAAIGAPAAMLIAWLLSAFAHVSMPAEVSAALGALIGALSGYFPLGGQAAHVVVNSIAE